MVVNRMMTWVMLLTMVAGALSQDVVEVQMKQGTIFAVSEETGVKGRHFYSFRNIPYAKPPIGDLRLQDPHPAESWEGRRNGSVVSSVCPQVEFIQFLQGKLVMIGEEDCLYLNVFTPKPISGSNLPVMVVIHGDGYFLGTGNDFPPLPLMTKDVILVTINYRLNVLGFLSTNDGVIPGNQGMKDMTMAFQWIQDNIRDLGGDPSRVTIFGSGTGGISAHLHMFIPKNEGLFHRVIMQSGTAISPGYLNANPRATAAAVGQKMCPGMENASEETLDSQALLDCLKETSPEDLVKVSNAFYKWAILPILFVPCADGDYLPDHPAKLIKEGKYLQVDMMGGMAKDQGALNTRPLFGKKGQVEDLVNKFSLVAPLTIYVSEEENPLYLAKRAFYHYLGNLSITPDTADELTQMFGDCRFATPLDNVASFHSRDASYGKHYYMYEMQHRGLGTFGGLYNLPFGQHWVTHADDLQYLFNDISFYPALQRKDDIMVSDIMLALWTNFAASGNPTPNQSLGFRWAPVNGSCLQHLGITTSPRMIPNTRSERVEFWRNMPTKQNMILYPERFLPDYLPPRNMKDPCGQ